MGAEATNNLSEVLYVVRYLIMSINHNLIDVAKGKTLDNFGRYYGVFRWKVFGIKVEPDWLFRKRITQELNRIIGMSE